MASPDELRTLVLGFRTSAALSVAATSASRTSWRKALGPLPTWPPPWRWTRTRSTDCSRALVAVGVYAMNDDGAFANTALGHGLRSDVPGTMRPLARTLQDPAVWAAWGHLAHSVRTGDNAFESLHGIDVWTHRERAPEQNAIFNANMAALQPLVAGAVADAYDFSELSSVVDVGGGQGVLLEAVLARNDHLTGTVFDQEHAVALAPTAGVSDSVVSRWSAVSGSFFESVPAADAHILKAILHDWPDDTCIEILRTCARSLHDGGVVLVVEMVLGRPGLEIEAAMSDLNMLVLPGGRERTEQEFAALFDAAGLRLTKVVHTPSRVSILEARV